ncbi:MAG: translation initiation factor IF-2 [Spirochaetia bacterium]|nr:translation initiation factor IF-2 [Spirochaetia bacterium]
MSEEQEKIEKPKVTLIKQPKREVEKTEPVEVEQEKKKVVIKKKKVVAKKKPAPADIPADNIPQIKAVAPAPEPPKAVPAQEHVPEVSKPAAVTEAPAAPKAVKQPENAEPAAAQPQTQSQPAPSQGQNREGYRSRDGWQGQGGGYRPRGENQGQNREGYRSRDGWQGQGGGYRPRGENQGQNREGYKPRDGWQGQGGGYRPRGENQGQGGGYRPRGENQGQNREGFRPRGEFRPEHQNSEVPMDMSGRTGNKKFFKAKKKTDYQKNKKENIEEIEKNFQIKKKDVQKANPVPKSIDIMEVITVAELAKKLNLKASEVITKFISMGMMVTINQQVDAASAEIIASEYDCKVNIVSLYEQTIVEGEKGDDADIVERPPVVTVMGHVDHGKTHLLDAIRETNVAGGEYGGITQHIGAYKVEVKGRSIVFLDTPGHEAFTQMRARGAQLTDIVVLVVAADDGVMPQTIEAINHAKEAKVPIVVAINKIDLPDANPEKIKQQLAEYELIPEEWGGNTIFCNISAKKKIGIDDLLDNILILADVLELKANPNCRAEGKIIESRVDQGRGMVSTVLIQRGTLKIGDAFVAGVYAGKVRAMFNDKGEKIESAGPATPVEILGFTGLPNSGDPFQVTESEKYARHIGEKRQELERIGVAKNVKKVTLDNLYDSIQEGEIQELKVIIKSDVQGSVEALKSTLEKLSTPEIRLHIIHASAGAIVENDVNLAAASNAIIVGFHVRPTSKAQVLAEQEKVEIKKYNIIYDAVEDIKRAMEGLLAPELKEELIGTVEVRDIFKVPKVGTIAGAYVTSGKVKRNAIAHLYREEIELFNGKIISLKRFKDDAKEVEKGFECGIGLENYNDIQIGDILEVFEIKEIAKKL